MSRESHRWLAVPVVLLTSLAVSPGVLRLESMSAAEGAGRASPPSAAPVDLVTDDPSGSLLRSGWAVLCHPEELETCTPDSPVMQKLADDALKAAQLIASLGFDGIALEPRTKAELEATGRALFTAAVPGATDFFLIEADGAWRFGEDGVGEHLEDSGTIRFSAGSNGIVLPIMQAVQRYEIPGFSPGSGRWGRHATWIELGTLWAVGSLSVSRAPRPGTRDWSRTLASIRDMDAYHSYAFWLSVDPSLQYLKPFFEHLHSMSLEHPIPDVLLYQHVGDALARVTGRHLEDHYLHFVEALTADTEYARSHCRPVSLQTEGGSLALTDPEVVPRFSLSVECADVTLVATSSLPGCGPGSAVLELEGTKGRDIFLLDDEWYEPGDRVEVGTSFRLWLVNWQPWEMDEHDLEDEHATIPDATMLHCGSTRVMELDYTVSVRAESLPLMEGEPWHDSFEETHFLDYFAGVRTTQTTEDWDTRESETRGIGPDDVLEQSEEASVPGAAASLRLSTRFSHTAEGFEVTGAIHAEAQAESSEDRVRRASSRVSWLSTLDIVGPAEVIVWPCELFEESAWDWGPIVDRSRRARSEHTECRFRVENLDLRSEIELPENLGSVIGSALGQAMSLMPGGSPVHFRLREVDVGSEDGPVSEEFSIAVKTLRR